MKKKLVSTNLQLLYPNSCIDYCALIPLKVKLQSGRSWGQMKEFNVPLTDCRVVRSDCEVGKGVVINSAAATTTTHASGQGTGESAKLCANISRRAQRDNIGSGGSLVRQLDRAFSLPSV